jgi:uncharacterized protein (TIGR03083 family)
MEWWGMTAPTDATASADDTADPVAEGAHAAAYRAAQARMIGLLTDLDGATAARIVPATPAWTVHDLVAHLAGVPVDVAAGRTPGRDLDAWTAAQVDARRDRTVPELVAEWRGAWPRFAPLLGFLADAEPLRASQVVFDTLSHEQDLRGALDRPGARDAEGWDLAWGFLVAMVARIRDRADVGALLLAPTDGEPVVAGTGETVATVRTSRFELCRAIAGRRSLAQIASWCEGPVPVGPMCVFPARDTDLHE